MKVRIETLPRSADQDYNFTKRCFAQPRNFSVAEGSCSGYTESARFITTPSKRNRNRARGLRHGAAKLVFNRLSYDVQLEIARLHIAHELARLRAEGFDLTLDESVFPFLLQRGFHPRLGTARSATRSKDISAAQSPTPPSRNSPHTPAGSPCAAMSLCFRPAAIRARCNSSCCHASWKPGADENRLL